MKEQIQQFSEQLIKALAIVASDNSGKLSKEITNIVICGFGGSGIGGKIVANWVRDELDLPIVLCQNYTIPKFVNDKTLFIACSYSGNTEEVISAVHAAKTKQAILMGVSSGGRLQELFKEWNDDHLVIPGGHPPRTQLGYSLVILCHLLVKANLLHENFLQKFKHAADFLHAHNETIEKEALAFTSNIKENTIHLYAEEPFEGVVIRARQQFNENAKVLCNHHVIPEMNHNELVGWAGASNAICTIFIENNAMHPQNRKRVEFSKQRIRSISQNIGIITAPDDKLNIVTETLYYIVFLDWVSFFYAKYKEIDPVEVNIITELKNSLN